MKISTIFLFTVLIFSTTKSFSQNNLLTSYKTYFDNDLKDWAHSFKNFQLSKFKLRDTTKFENILFGDTGNLKKFYELYKPALSFSGDSTEFIDIYSYWLNLEKKGNKIVDNPEVDQAVLLCDLKSNECTRIFFCGYSSRIEEVLWLTNARFILVGTEMDDSNILHPIIFVADITKQIFLVYKDSSSMTTKTGYVSPKLKKLSIQKE